MDAIRPVDCHLAQIRSRLNSSYSYLMFENELSSGLIDDFVEIRAMLSRYGNAIVSHKYYREIRSRKLLLVAELDPAQAEHIKNRILNGKFSKRITVYFYRRDRRSNQHQAERC
jgi:hypothetical protein